MNGDPLHGRSKRDTAPGGRRRNPFRSDSLPLWMLAVLTAFVAGLLLRLPLGPPAPAALAQVAPAAGGRGVYAFTGQLDASRFGLFMLDIEQGTIWVYELDQVDGVRKLKLVAARSWVYDRYLRDFNVAPPSFREVQELVARQRAYEMQAATESGPSPDSPLKSSTEKGSGSPGGP